MSEFKLNMVNEVTTVKSTSDPEVWGPAFWFSLHNGSLRYPMVANKIYRKHARDFILGIPIMLPCEKCKKDATEFIYKNIENIKEAVQSREKLFKFYVDFHNHVNLKLGKKKVSYKDAFNMYSNGIKINCIKYKNL